MNSNWPNFPEVREIEKFDKVLWMNDGVVKCKEVATGAVTDIEQDIRDYLSALPPDTRIGIVMPDGSIGKITSVRGPYGH